MLTDHDHKLPQACIPTPYLLLHIRLGSLVKDKIRGYDPCLLRKEYSLLHKTQRGPIASTFCLIVEILAFCIYYIKLLST